MQNNDELKESAIVGVNEEGRVVGEDHPNATLSDKEIDRMRELREDSGHSYGKLASLFKVSKGYVRDVCTYRRRGHTVRDHKPMNFSKKKK